MHAKNTHAPDALTSYFWCSVAMFALTITDLGIMYLMNTVERVSEVTPPSNVVVVVVVVVVVTVVVTVGGWGGDGGCMHA
jgi:hypothetical protein